jgi:hypothetical protein
MNYIFGAFCAERWRPCHKYYGTGESFVFTFRDNEDLEVSAATQHDELYQLGNTQGLSIGGGEPTDYNKQNGTAIRLKQGFAKGSSGISATYDNNRLCGVKTKE